MPICIYPSDADDFSTNGLGLMTPTECWVYGEDGHFTELEMVQPIDGTNRWAQLRRDMIVKAPAPVRESPWYAEDITDDDTHTVQRRVMEVTGKGKAKLYNGIERKKKALGSFPVKTEMVELETSGDWTHATVVKGGQIGWIQTARLAYKRTATEQVRREGPVGQRVVQYRQAGDQLWRIISVEPDTGKGTVTVKAQHIFYDLQYNIVDGELNLQGERAPDAFQALWDSLMEEPEHVLHVGPGLEDLRITGDYSHKNPVEALLDPDEGMLSQVNARLVLDNWDVWILPGWHRDNGMTLRRGKNLKGVQVTDDAANVVTRIIPQGKDKKGEPLYITDGTGPKHNAVDSPRIGAYAFPRVQLSTYDVKVAAKAKDADGETAFRTEAEARAKLKELAQADFSEKGVDLPGYGMKVDFELVENAGEYAGYEGLQALYLGDTVTVIDSLIALTAQVEVTGFKFNALTRRYSTVTLGDVESLNERVYSYQLPTGGVSGTKIAQGSADGGILRSLSVQYAKIATAAVEQLSAEAITALTAYIGELTADTITTDTLVANIAHMLELSAGHINAQDIDTDALAAQLAEIAVLCAGTATFDRATVQHLVAEAMNLSFGVGDEVFINNLKVAYAQMVSAAIGNLCVKASDGNYYTIDVDTDGTVTATRATVSPEEIDAGQTDAGRVILGTDITAQDLSTGNLLATYALVNKLDAARIDVDQLFARQAFVDQLNTHVIQSPDFIEIMTGAVDDSVADAMDEATPAVLRIDSSRGTVFKDNQVATVLSVAIHYGSQIIENPAALRAAFGAGAYLQWEWLRLDDDRYGVLSRDDSRLSNGGFQLTLGPADVDVKVTFRCVLMV